jgi:hypothetical protein
MHRKTKKERHLADGRWEGGGRGAEPFDRKKLGPPVTIKVPVVYMARYDYYEVVLRGAYP